MTERRKLPPLNAVRAFEAAARLGGFVAAGEELAVTPSAISQQVKGLEEWLGLRLFVRHAQGLELTTAGGRYLAPLTDALDRIDGATRAVMPQRVSRALNVTSLSSFAAQWLAPRLPTFSSAFPDIDLRLSTTDAMMDLHTDDIDIALRYGNGIYPGLEAEKLFGEKVTPVCSPGLLQTLRCGSENGQHSLDNLANVILMHDYTAGLLSVITWAGWLDAVGRPDLKRHLPIDRGPSFSDSHFLVQAAIAGRGVMLGRGALVADPLANGSLVAPFPASVQSPFSYWFVTLPGAKSDPRISAFHGWLMGELARLKGSGGFEPILTGEQ